MIEKPEEMPITSDRLPSHPEGYFESDADWCRRHPDAVAWLIDNHAAIRAAVEHG